MLEPGFIFYGHMDLVDEDDTVSIISGDLWLVTSYAAKVSKAVAFALP